MFLVTVTVKDTDTNREYSLRTFPVIPGRHVENIEINTPMIDKGGVILYRLSVDTLAHKDE